MPTPPRPIKLGPWIYSEFLGLSRLLAEISKPKPPTNALIGLFERRGFGLLGEYKEPPKESAIEDDTTVDWERLLQDPLFKKLRKDRNFERLVTKFGKLIYKKSSRSEERAIFRFLADVLDSAALYFSASDRRAASDKASKSTKAATKKGVFAYADSRKKALRAIRTLQRLAKQGIGLDVYSDNDKLFSLLTALSGQLEKQKSKKRETAKTAASNATKHLALMLWIRFEVSSPAVLQAFQTWAGIELDPTNTAKYSSGARLRAFSFLQPTSPKA